MAKSSDMDGLLLAMGVGTALSAWAGFEVRLTHLFAVLSDMPDEAKACAVFDAIISFEVRLELCNRLMEMEDCEPTEKALWKKFAGCAWDLYRKRHAVAHFSIVEKTKKGGGRIVRLAPFLSQSKLAGGRAEFMSSDDLKRRADDFHELREALVWFWAGARQRRGQSQESVSPIPPLILRLRGASSQTQQADE